MVDTCQRRSYPEFWILTTQNLAYALVNNLKTDIISMRAINAPGPEVANMSETSSIEIYLTV